MGFNVRQPRLRAAAGFVLGPAAALAVSACATAAIDGPTALDGRDLDTAIGFYGPFNERLEVGGKTFYVWRRAVAVDGRSVGCELRAEVAFRKQIRTTELQGFPAACLAFSVQFTAMASNRPAARETSDAPPVLRAAAGCPGCRPVGASVATAQAAASRSD